MSPESSVSLKINGNAVSPQQVGCDELGLLVTADPATVRAFRRELRDCAAPATFDIHPNIEHALRDGNSNYRWVTVDLDGTFAPAEAVRLARTCWPDARVAVLSYWWSERDAVARDQADAVIHKPLRSTELGAFVQPAGRAPVVTTPLAVGAPLASAGG